MMKMKRIAAVLTALSVLSGCSGNTVTGETVTTTGTTTEVVTVETTTEAEVSDVGETTTEKDKEQISKGNSEFDSTKESEPSGTRPPVPMPTGTRPTTITEQNAEITEQMTEATEQVSDIEIQGIELVTFPTETPCSEIDSLAITLVTLRLELATGVIISRTFENNLDIVSIGDESIDTDNNFIIEYGCTPSVAIKAYKKFSFQKLMIDLTGSESSKLYEYIDEEIPVMVWVTENLAEPEIVFSGDNFTLYGPKEVVVLAGYTEDYVKVWSPIDESYKVYDRALFEQRYEEMGSMALTVVKE